MGADLEYLRAMNVLIMGTLIVVCVIVLLAVGGKSSAYARADRFSMQVRLPYGSSQTRESVVSRLQAASRARTVALLIGVLAACPLLATPLATTPLFPLIAMFPVLIVTSAASAVMSVRERLFHPAPTAPRVARARALGVGDYLDPFRRALPWGLTCSAGVAVAVLVVTWLRAPDQVNPLLAAIATIFSIGALATLIVVPLLEGVVLARPQPASDTLELAWDDAFRATTIGQLRLSMAFAAWMVLACAVAALWVGSGSAFSGLAWQLPTLGLLALQLVYPGTGRRLQAELYPDWLRRPVAVGGTA
jgi:hypothetical protein